RMGKSQPVCRSTAASGWRYSTACSTAPRCSHTKSRRAAVAVLEETNTPTHKRAESLNKKPPPLDDITDGDHSVEQDAVAQTELFDRRQCPGPLHRCVAPDLLGIQCWCHAGRVVVAIDGGNQ